MVFRDWQEPREAELPGTWELSPGLYQLTVRTNGRTAEIRFPFLVLPFVVSRKHSVKHHIKVPLLDDIPDGFVHIPAGWFSFGLGKNKDIEPVRVWSQTTPLHRRRTESFLIAKYETTWEQWLEFLDALPEGEKSAYMPKAGDPNGQPYIALIWQNEGWNLEYRPFARYGPVPATQPIMYSSRDRRQEQNWLRFPVTGISAEQAQAYLDWLDRSGKVPNARFCREDEWERAARGADDRKFPHGDQLDPDDANFDRTYGRQKEAYGLDEVGSHPRSQSVFGLDDMIGNAREMTIPVIGGDALFALRGGTYYHEQETCSIPNRDIMHQNGPGESQGGFAGLCGSSIAVMSPCVELVTGCSLVAFRPMPTVDRLGSRKLSGF